MWTLAATVHCLLAAALLLTCCLQSLMATEDDVTPRISFPYSKSKIITRYVFVGIAKYTEYQCYYSFSNPLPQYSYCPIMR